MAIPTLDLSRAYTNEARKATADAYRQAMTDYYKTLNPTYQYKTPDYEYAEIPDRFNSFKDILRGKGLVSTKKIARRTGTYTTNTVNPWEKDVASITQTPDLLNQYQQNYRAVKPMTAGSRGARRSAMGDWISGRVYGWLILFGCVFSLLSGF